MRESRGDESLPFYKTTFKLQSTFKDFDWNSKSLKVLYEQSSDDSNLSSQLFGKLLTGFLL